MQESSRFRRQLRDVPRIQGWKGEMGGGTCGWDVYVGCDVYNPHTTTQVDKDLLSSASPAPDREDGVVEIAKWHQNKCIQAAKVHAVLGKCMYVSILYVP